MQTDFLYDGQEMMGTKTNKQCLPANPRHLAARSGWLADISIAAVAMVALMLVSGSPVNAQPSAQEPAGQGATSQALLPKPALKEEDAGAPRKVSPTGNGLLAGFAGRTLSIQDVVALTLAVNSDLVAARETVLSARGNTLSVRSSQGLTVNGSGTAGRYDEAQTTNFGGQNLVTQNQNTATVSGTVSLPIDLTGALASATSQAEYEEIAAKLDVMSTQNSVVLSVKSAFYSVLRDKALVSVAEADLLNAQANLKDAQLRFAAGTTTRYDVVSAQASAASSEQSLNSARTSLGIAFATLNNAIGIDVDTQLDLKTEGAVVVPATPVPDTARSGETHAPDFAAPLPEDSLRDIKPGENIGDSGAALAKQSQSFQVNNPTVLGADYAPLVAEAMKNRPEIMRDDASIAAARKGIQVARKSGLPSLSLAYTRSYTPTATSGSSTSTGEAYVSVSVPIFDSGYRSGKVTQARASVSRAETIRRQTVDSVVLDLRKAYVNVRQSLVQLTSARTGLAKADEGYRLAQLRYTTGVTSSSYTSPLLELSDAQKTLSTARKDYVNALYDYNNNLSALDKAAGRYAIAQ